MLSPEKDTSGVSELDSLEQLIERELNPEIEFAEFRKTRTYFVEPHFVDNALNVESVVRKKRNAPFPVVQPGCTGYELPDPTRVLPSYARMAAHQSLTIGKGQSVPVVLVIAPLAHGVKTENWPVCHIRIEPVLQILRHSRAEFDEGSFQFR